MALFLECDTCEVADNCHENFGGHQIVDDITEIKLESQLLAERMVEKSVSIGKVVTKTITKGFIIGRQCRIRFFAYFSAAFIYHNNFCKIKYSDEI